MVYSSANKLNFLNGELIIKTGLGILTDNAPVSYQDANEISTKFKFLNQKRNSKKGWESEIKFEVGNYDHNKVLKIDPNLVWATYYGGNNYDGPMSITTDDSNNVFVCGYSASPNFPVIDQGGGSYYQGNFGGVSDAFVIKFNPNGAMMWCTYYGGSGDDAANSLDVDPFGNILITGQTLSTDLPLLNPLGGAYFQSFLSGGLDAFVLKLDPNGVLVWASYFGGGAWDEGNSIVSDASGNIFITGQTQSVDFPTLNFGSGAFYQPLLNNFSIPSINEDVFILKFNSNCVLQWSTFYGGQNSDEGNAIHINNSGDIYITGNTRSFNFPVQNNSGSYFQPNILSANSAFILHFNNIGVLKWASFFGGNCSDAGYSLTSDNIGNIFLAGNSCSKNLPMRGYSHQDTIKGLSDAFLVKFNTNDSIIWSTYYGTSGNDNFFTFDNLVADKCGNVIMSFNTDGSNLNALQMCDTNYFDNSSNGLKDIVVSKFSNDGKLEWSTYLGGDGEDFREAVALDNYGDLYVAGEWRGSGVGNDNTYPFKDPGSGSYFTNVFAGGHDGYIAKFKPLQFNLSSNKINPSSCGCNGKVTVTVNCSIPDYSYTWSNGEIYTNTNSTFSSIDSLCPGNYWVEVKNQCNERDTIYFTLSGSNYNIIPSYTYSPVCSDSSGVLTINQVSNGVPNYSVSDGSNLFGSNINFPVTFSNVSIGIHTITINDINGCSGIFTVNIVSSSVTAKFTTNVNTGPAPLNVNFTNLSLGATNYTWSFGTALSNQVNPSNVFTNIGIFPVLLIASNDYCSDSSLMYINVVNDIFIPEALTPNGDGKNDFFEIKGLENYSNNNLEIFNRWGNKIYSAKPYKNDWNGSTNSNERTGNGKLPSGTYFYLLNLGDDKKSIYKGFVQLQY
jgi:gliding motility-associated-like protein